MGGRDSASALALFEDASTIKAEAVVKLVTRTFVRVELPDPYAPTTFPLPNSGLERGQTLLVAGREDEQFRPETPDAGSDAGKSGLRILAVKVADDYAHVPWPEEPQPEPAANDSSTADQADDEWDWSDV